MKLRNTKSFLLVVALLAPVFASAQNADSEELNIIEMELEKAAPPAPAPRAFQEQTAKDTAITGFSGLGTLAPFSEISVIQKRYLPKTGRFQLFGGLTTVTNDPFFLTFGGVAKASYFFSETWGVELNYFGLTTSNRQGTDDLRSELNVTTENLVYSKSYVGLDLMFVPIYGKMTWFNQKIVPFDLYFSGGLGTTATQSGENAATLHLAAGQIFAISKAYAFRWDFSWNFFNATGIDKSTSTFNNLFLTVGMSWFFPEASYR